MNYEVMRLLDREEVERIVSGLGQRTFADGKLTAHGQAREVKHNLQLKRQGPQITELDEVVLAACKRSVDFQAFALPKRLLMPLFSRYEPGMEYGSHIDSALTGGGNGIRTDLAMTLFLSQPASYDGGELVIELPIGEEAIKLDAGEAVVYSATTIHHVAPVTRGVRLAAVTWIQSVVRDERLRTILYDLTRASRDPVVAANPEVSLLLGKSYHNLLRYAAEP